jgi:GNAT superfamily N-acetyltransferase
VLNVRDAIEDDTESIVELTAEGWRAAYAGIVSPQHLERLPIAAWRHDVRQGIRSPEAQSFTHIAELDGRPTGYCYVAAPGRDEPLASPVVEVVALYVHPAAWRRGIGRELLQRATEEAGRRGFEEMILWSFERNERALAFYTALGLRPDGARRPHRPTGAPVIRLRMAISRHNTSP